MTKRYYIDFSGRTPTVTDDVHKAISEGNGLNDILVVESVGWVDWLLEEGVIEE